MTNKKIFIAFTLAEVLITLGIIGIVANMTIPTLVQSYQKTQYVTQLKKAYAIFSGALTQLTNDEGCSRDLKCTGLFNYDPLLIGDKIVPYFRVLKNCKTTNSDCFAPVYFANYDRTTTGTPLSDVFAPNGAGPASGTYSFEVADGMSFLIKAYNCNVNYGLSGGDPIWACGWLLVDVNGPKRPNILGRDTFSFIIANGKLLYPDGGSKVGQTFYLSNTTIYGVGGIHWKDYGCGASTWTQAGWTCTGRIIEEGWKMNY